MSAKLSNLNELRNILTQKKKQGYSLMSIPLVLYDDKPSVAIKMLKRCVKRAMLLALLCIDVEQTLSRLTFSEKAAEEIIIIINAINQLFICYQRNIFVAPNRVRCTRAGIFTRLFSLYSLIIFICSVNIISFKFVVLTIRGKSTTFFHK